MNRLRPFQQEGWPPVIPDQAGDLLTYRQVTAQVTQDATGYVFSLKRGLSLDLDLFVAGPLEGHHGGLFGGGGVKDQSDGAGFDIKLGHGCFPSWSWAIPCCVVLDVIFIGGLMTRLVRRGKIMGVVH